MGLKWPSRRRTSCHSNFVGEGRQPGAEVACMDRPRWRPKQRRSASRRETRASQQLTQQKSLEAFQKKLTFELIRLVRVLVQQPRAGGGRATSSGRHRHPTISRLRPKSSLPPCLCSTTGKGKGLRSSSALAWEHPIPMVLGHRCVTQEKWLTCWTAGCLWIHSIRPAPS